MCVCVCARVRVCSSQFQAFERGRPSTCVYVGAGVGEGVWVLPGPGGRGEQIGGASVQFWPGRLVLGAGRAGGALQGGLGEAARQRADGGVGQGGRGEQLVPAADRGGNVQLLQKYLGHSHEALVVHATVVTPHDHLPDAAVLQVVDSFEFDVMQ